jgi:hypothetical protein
VALGEKVPVGSKVGLEEGTFVGTELGDSVQLKASAQHRAFTPLSLNRWQFVVLLLNVEPYVVMYPAAV